MNAEEIIRFIHDAKKTTPVKAYVKACLLYTSRCV